MTAPNSTWMRPSYDDAESMLEAHERKNMNQHKPPTLAPVRVQRRRTKGWKMPPNTVSVCRPGRWGNPFRVTEERTPAQAVNAFEAWLTTTHITAGIPEKKAAILGGLNELRGKNLACFCALNKPCHADVLLRMANQLT